MLIWPLHITCYYPDTIFAVVVRDLAVAYPLGSFMMKRRNGERGMGEEGDLASFLCSLTHLILYFLPGVNLIFIVKLKFSESNKMCTQMKGLSVSNSCLTAPQKDKKLSHNISACTYASCKKFAAQFQQKQQIFPRFNLGTF